MGSSNNFIIDVGDILDIIQFETLEFKLSADDVKENKSPSVADMDIIINRRSTDKHFYRVLIERDELFFGFA